MKMFNRQEPPAGRISPAAVRARDAAKKARDPAYRLIGIGIRDPVDPWRATLPPVAGDFHRHPRRAGADNRFDVPAEPFQPRLRITQQFV